MDVDFVNRAVQIHGNKYTYDFVQYKNALTKVIIVCKIHGKFYQTPAKHLRGQGCPNCSRYRKKTKQEFKDKAEKIHNLKYDYSLTDFSNIKNTVTIICPAHGQFNQTLDKHINFKHGCPTCGGSKKKTLEQFILEAKLIHGELYDYSKSKYNNFETKLIIICKRHGEFLQTPHNHIIGKQGCPHCVHRISAKETKWLNHIGLPNDSDHRNVWINLHNRNIKADGYNPITKTVYEFYGDYYHGNPMFYKEDAINPHTKCNYGVLYQKTIEKEIAIKECGLNLISIWEYQWDQNEKL